MLLVRTANAYSLTDKKISLTISLNNLVHDKLRLPYFLIPDLFLLNANKYNLKAS